MIMRSLYLTKKCNMRCLMCYEKDKESEYTYKQLTSIIDELYETDKQSTDKVVYEFLGGEPLLVFPIMRDIVRYIEELYFGRDILFQITSNGTILSDEILCFLKNHTNISLSISFEGTNFSQMLRIMANGENSFDLVSSNLKRFITEGISPTVHMVVTPYTVCNLSSNIKKLAEEFNVTKIEVGIVESTMKIDDTFLLRFAEEMDQVSMYVLDNNRNVSINLLERYVHTEKLYIMDRGSVVGEIYAEKENVEYTSTIYDIVRPTGSTHVDRLRKVAYQQHRLNTAMMVNGAPLFGYKKKRF